ncbi:hypothetical protein ID875_31530 [Streptomyces globisporus]|uniref:Alcohol dehydrogenase-like C-terminal domain-containing protein n=1 Tax=Streptomyces globisporus TaxID=1908 RepID=A0A927GQ36_STRGL|nr:hypothetical protein [Streptomyces globisporus]
MPGGAAEFAVAPVANCVRLPDHIDVRDAALIEPLSCAVRGYDVLNGNLGAQVLIYGSGTMGLMMLELAKRTGAASVDVLDVNAQRLATATTLGCTGAAARADELDRPGGWTSSSTRRATRRRSRTGWGGSPRAVRSSSSGSRTTPRRR